MTKCKNPNVVTYRLAYLDAQINLCDRCAKAPPAPLGPVQHGKHYDPGGCGSFWGPHAARLARELREEEEASHA